jgi:hypothetical protein
MINLKLLISNFYNILNTKQTFFEILLNLTFVLILLIIAVIFYWDNINRKIINTSRCKIVMNNDDNIFNLDIYNSESTKKLLKISYDNTKKHNVKIDCACPVGNTVNNFRVPYYNYEDQKLEKDLYKYCKCDADYSANIRDGNYKYDGDAFLQDYYKQVFTDLDNVDKDKRLIFPS